MNNLFGQPQGGQGPQNNAFFQIGAPQAAPPGHSPGQALPQFPLPWAQHFAAQVQAQNRPPKRPASPAVSDSSSRPPSPTSILGSETAASGILMLGAPEDPRGSVIKHEDLYYENIVFRAGNTLFKVPRFGLPEEGVFSDMFTLPVMEGTMDGMTDDNPIILPSEITAYDFQSLLRTSHSLARHGAGKLDLREWLAVIKVSTIWCMDKLRAKAISQSEILFPASFSAVDRLLLGRELRVAEWMLKAYEELGRRPMLLDARERELIGIPRSFKVMELRERSVRWAEKGHGRSRVQYDFRRKVKELFADDLARDRDYQM